MIFGYHGVSKGGFGFNFFTVSTSRLKMHFLQPIYKQSFRSFETYGNWQS
ncbi:hypothetical protein ADIS_2445 [Lunatimonas lonarensis]|uniref:Uncharacterized protein n=1 Tax=Lunatimonas lonarensis TaxID=1232681 RepID=R7ZSN9_9BACT|nr:hypothetical protein ADIS_2445 [Lunatimonas lonarensis]